MPALFALFLWWFGTLVVLVLDGLPTRTFRVSLAGAGVFLAASLVGIWSTRADLSVGGAYLAFGFGLLIWGCQQLAFYTGALTGPRRHACPQGCRGWRHFLHAVETNIYHEAGIAVGAAAIVAATWGAANQVGTWTYLMLWVMHTSAKLNVFLGVRNLNEDFLPAHLRYLESFLKRRPMNQLFPWSVTAATVLAAWLVQRAAAATAGSFEAVSCTLLATLTILALLEHWFLVLPIPAERLWSWGLRSRPAREVPPIRWEAAEER